MLAPNLFLDIFRIVEQVTYYEILYGSLMTKEQTSCYNQKLQHYVLEVCVVDYR